MAPERARAHGGNRGGSSAFRISAPSKQLHRWHSLSPHITECLACRDAPAKSPSLPSALLAFSGSRPRREKRKRKRKKTSQKSALPLPSPSLRPGPVRKGPAINITQLGTERGHRAGRREDPHRAGQRRPVLSDALGAVWAQHLTLYLDVRGRWWTLVDSMPCYKAFLQKDGGQALTPQVPAPPRGRPNQLLPLIRIIGYNPQRTKSRLAMACHSTP